MGIIGVEERDKRENKTRKGETKNVSLSESCKHEFYEFLGVKAPNT